VALMKDGKYFDQLESGYQSILDKDFSESSPALDLMWRSIELHLAQIKTDPFERKLARPLDYGHEWGHRCKYRKAAGCVRLSCNIM